MDTRWVRRLFGVADDQVVGQSFLADYCRTLRLLSGLCESSLGRLMRDSYARRRSDAFRRQILTSDEVVRFMAFLRGFRRSELPVVLEVLCQEMYPGRPGSLFRAASMDPFRAKRYTVCCPLRSLFQMSHTQILNWTLLQLGIATPSLKLW